MPETGGAKIKETTYGGDGKMVDSKLRVGDSKMPDGSFRRGKDRALPRSSLAGDAPSAASRHESKCGDENRRCRFSLVGDRKKVPDGGEGVQKQAQFGVSTSRDRGKRVEIVVQRFEIDHTTSQEIASA